MIWGALSKRRAGQVLDNFLRVWTKSGQNLGGFGQILDNFLRIWTKVLYNRRNTFGGFFVKFAQDMFLE